MVFSFILYLDVIRLGSGWCKLGSGRVHGYFNGDVKSQSQFNGYVSLCQHDRSIEIYLKQSDVFESFFNNMTKLQVFTQLSYELVI